MSAAFPLPSADPAAHGLDPSALDRLDALIRSHVAEKRYPGAQVAIARNGHLVFDRTYGEARIGRVATPDTLWLIYSNTKPLVAATLWSLADAGLLRFDDRVCELLPGFERHGKNKVLVRHLLTHQGGFPSAAIPSDAWEDHGRIRELVCDFRLDWPTGQRAEYHPGSAHWVAAMVVEAVTGRDFREVLRERVIAPCGLDREIVVGLGDTDLDRAADMHAVDAGGFVADEQEYEPATKKAGRPGGGGYATARGLAAFYQALLAGGVLPGRGRIASRAMLAYALRDWTPGLPDGDGNPASRGLGVMMRGPAERPSAMGAVASPSTFGHGGLGSSQCWADPTTGLSFAYITNARQDDPWHSRRMDIVSSMAHAAVL